MRHRIVVLAVAALAATPVATSSAADTIPPSRRAHSRLATYIRNGVRIQRLQATMTGATVRVRATVHNDLHLVSSVAIRVASCPSTAGSVPRCTAPRVVTLPLPSSRTRDLDRTFAVRAGGGVEVAVTPARAPARRRRPQDTYAELLIGRGATGRTWGLSPLADHAGTSVGRVAVLLSGLSGSMARASVAWTGRSGTGATLTTSLAGHPIGDPTVLAPGAATGSFFDRPAIARPGDSVRMVVSDVSQSELASVVLPFPRR